MSLPNHGANPAHFVRALGASMKEDSIDFSVNTNPYGPPKKIADSWSTYFNKIEQYPEPSSLMLRKTIAKEEQLNIDNVLIGNGAAELIYLIANLYKGKQVLLIEPTFSEYGDACRAFSCPIRTIHLQKGTWKLKLDDIVAEFSKVDILFLCHPNNPTGVKYDTSQLVSLLQEAKAHHVTVVIDEAFYDFSTEPITLAPAIKTNPNLIILRSMTKMYSIPGIRLGYMLASEQLIERIRVFQHPWSVNSLAQQIGLLCVEDKNHARATAIMVKEERERLEQELQSIGYILSSSSVNYYLLTKDGLKKEMNDFLLYLVNNGIIPRHTYNFSGLDGAYVRLAVKSQTENDRLIEVLKGWQTICSSS